MVTFLSARESQKFKMGGEYLVFSMLLVFFGGLLKTSTTFGTLVKIFAAFSGVKKNGHFIFQLLEALKVMGRYILSIKSFSAS